MKVIYVAHPLGMGVDREANRRSAAEWCGWIAETFKVAISADWIVLSGVWDESKRALGINANLEMVERADEVWLVGTRVTGGMVGEENHAKLHHKTVRDFTGLSRDEIAGIIAEEADECPHGAPRGELCVDCRAAAGDDGFDPNACPGCGGNCRTACR